MIEPSPRRKRIAMVAVVSALALGVIAAAAWQMNKEQGYVIARFRTGDIYFGRLRWLPSPRLEHAWILEQGMNGTEPVTSVNQISKAPWKPLDILYFNPAELATWSPLAPDSPFLKAFEDPSILSGLPPREAGEAAP